MDHKFVKCSAKRVIIWVETIVISLMISRSMVKAMNPIRLINVYLSASLSRPAFISKIHFSTSSFINDSVSPDLAAHFDSRNEHEK